jgi:hypothetical protein
VLDRNVLQVRMRQLRSKQEEGREEAKEGVRLQLPRLFSSFFHYHW